MAELNRLIPDIYDMLQTMSDGEDINAQLEPHIEPFINDIREVMKNWATPQKRDRSDGIRMSNLGVPNRKLYYDMRSEESTIPNEHPSIQIRFLYGHIIEAIIIMLVKAAGHEVTDEQKEVMVEGIKGHMDCKIDGEVIDVKSASPFGFNKFVKGTLPEDDPFGYMAQIAAYEEAEGTSNGGNLVMDKVSGRLCLFIPEDLDKPNIVERIKEVKEIKTLDTPPELCYPTELQGTKGNKVINRKCNYCPHIEECHSDSNDGRGVRKFQYSTGIKYFTEVIDKPRVEEVL